MKNQSTPQILNIAQLLREGRGQVRRHDLRRAIREDRANGREVLLYARPGTIVNHQGSKCFVSNKGRAFPFAAN